ncbi:Protein of unknown function [Pyronema omphalodes CBS 100304]|uniref:Uncharacterized protein n=1 Tax=Pyronema omphalodes (strain CBS 100304) TaxID=1076935 RepID=U4L787_PYROM|nr:Protein of unknown function [Pyronema omphalodes CBS 100304]
MVCGMVCGMVCAHCTRTPRITYIPGRCPHGRIATATALVDW